MQQIVPKTSHAQEEQTHWDKFSFIRDKRENGTISIHYVPTDKMAANIFTKSFSVSKVETFRTVLMGTDSTQSAQVGVELLEYRSNYSLERSENYLVRKLKLPDYKDKSKLILITEFV